MTQRFSFSAGGWEPADFDYVYAIRNRPGARFTQDSDCIMNRPCDAKEKFEYISMVSKTQQHAGVLLETHCSFEVMGAPLLVFSDDISKGRDGLLWYGQHYEIVAYDGGINVWRIDPDGDSAVSVNLLREKFSVSANEIHCLRARIFADRLEISLDGHSVILNGTFPSAFRAGITACEGINRFYDFSIEA